MIDYEKLEKISNTLDGNTDITSKEFKETLLNIGEQFRLSKEDFEKDKVSRENIFANSNKVIIIG